MSQDLHNKSKQLQATERELIAKINQLQTDEQESIAKIKQLQADEQESINKIKLLQAIEQNLKDTLEIENDIIYLLEQEHDTDITSEILESDIGGSISQRFIQHTYKNYYNAISGVFKLLLRRTKSYNDFHITASHLFISYKSIDPANVDITLRELLKKINTMTQINKLCIKLINEMKLVLPINKLYDIMIGLLADRENIMQEYLNVKRVGGMDIWTFKEVSHLF